MINYSRYKLSKGITPLLLVVAFTFISLLVAGAGYGLQNFKEGKYLNVFESYKKSLYLQESYLDAKKVNQGVFSPIVVGTVNLPNGSFSAFKVIEGKVGNNGESYLNEAKVEFLSGDLGLGIYKDGIIAPFYLKNGEKTVGTIVSRAVTELNSNGVSYPLIIIQGEIEKGRLTGDFVAQTFDTGYILAGRVDANGKVNNASVETGAAKKTEAETIIAKNALSLFKIAFENLKTRVLGASTDSYQVVGSTKPIYNSTTGSWIFAAVPGTNVSISPVQNIINYLTILNQSGQSPGGSQNSSNSIYQFLPAYLQPQASALGISSIKSSTPNLSVTTSGSEVTLSLDLSGLGSSLSDDSIKTSYLKDGAVNSAKISDGSITSTDIYNDTIGADKLSSVLTFSDGDLLDLSSITHNSTSKQGLILPNVSSSNPSKPISGKGYLAYDTANDQVIFYNGSAWGTVGSGTITSVTAGNGLTGGGSSGSVTLSINTTDIFNCTSSSTQKIIWDSVNNRFLCATDQTTGGSASSLSSITNALSSNTISNGDFSQVWNWSLTTANKTAFSFGESSASVASGDPYILGVSTLPGSTANPLLVTAGGTSNGIKVDINGLLSAVGTGGIKATDLASGTYSNALTLSNASNSITAGTLNVGSDSITDITGTGLSVSGNTLNVANVPNSSLTNSSITVTAGTGLTGGGVVSLGSSVTLNAAQDIATSASPTFNGLTLTATSNQLVLGTTNTTTITVTPPSSSKVATIPALTSDDSFVFLNQSQTLTNKTISAASNTISGLTNANLSGSAGITNANLANSSLTISTGGILTGGGVVSLGGSLSLTATEADTLSSVTSRGASTATALTLSNSSPITFSGTNPTVTFSGGEVTFDLTGAATRTLTLLNSTPSQVANLNLSDGSLQTGGVVRLDSSGNLSNIANISGSGTLSGFTISGSANTISNIGNSSLTNSSITVTAGTGLTGGGVVSLGSSVTLNAAQDIATSASPTFNGLTLTATSNQLVLGTTNTTTISSVAPSSSKVATIPALTSDDSFVFLTQSQTLTNKTISASSNTISGLTNANLSGSAGITNANLANSSLTINSGGILTGGGVVSLGGSLSLTATEADTLSSVTSRGASTTTALSLGDVTIGTNNALVVGSYASDPSTPANGTIWYNTTSGKWKIREGGTTKVLCNTTDLGCGSGGGGISTVKEGGSNVVTSATSANFAANDFTVTDETGGQAGIAIDYTNSKITRSDQAQTISGGWTFNTNPTTFTTGINANGGLTPGANQNLSFTSGTGTFVQNYSNTTGASSTINHTNSASSGTNSSTGLSLALTGTNNAGGSNTITAINFANITPATNNTFYGLVFGTGFTDILRYNGTQIISGTGVLQSPALSGTYSNALTLSNASNALTGTIGQSTPLAGSFTTLSASTSLTISAFSTAGVVTNTSAGVLGTLAGTSTTVLHGNASGTPTFSSVTGSDLASNITISTTGNISTTGTGAISSAGAITAPTTTNTINGLIINSGALSGVTGITFSSGNISGAGTVSAGATTITSNSTGALSVGANGATNPVLQVDASTASVATGLKILGAATGGTTALSVIDSGTNANLSISAKGSGTITLASGSTGNIQFFNSNNTITSSGALTVAGTTVIGSGGNTFTFNPSSGPLYAGTARPTKRISIDPEYPGAVLTGDGTNNIGTMTSDNMTSTPFRNYYNWTTSQATNQDYDIWVKIPVPMDFAAMASTPTLSIDTYTTDITNGTVLVTVYDTAGTADCTGASFTPSATTTWQTRTQTTCLDTGTYTAGGTITMQIKVQAAASGGITRVGKIQFDYLAKY